MDRYNGCETVQTYWYRGHTTHEKLRCFVYRKNLKMNPELIFAQRPFQEGLFSESGGGGGFIRTRGRGLSLDGNLRFKYIWLFLDGKL